MLGLKFSHAPIIPVARAPTEANAIVDALIEEEEDDIIKVEVYRVFIPYVLEKVNNFWRNP